MRKSLPFVSLIVLVLGEKLEMKEYPRMPIPASTASGFTPRKDKVG